MLRFFLVLLVLSSFSCQTFKNAIPYESKSKHEQEIAALKAEFSQKMEASNLAILNAAKAQLAAKDAQIQAVADSLYGQSITFKAIVSPTRTDLILRNLSEEAWAAIDHLLPTYDQMVKINERIASELDETKTTLADLQKSHDAVVAQNEKLSEAEKVARQKVEEAENVKRQMQLDYQKQIEEKQAALIAEQSKINQMEKERSDNAAARQAQIAKLSWGAGILAALCLAAAIFSPVFKTELGICAATLGGAAVALPFIEPWMVLVGFGVIVAVIVVWAIRRFHVSDKTNSALVNVLHDIETKAKADYDKIVAPILAEYTTKYTKASDGTITTVTDKSIINQIDSKLIASDRK